MAKILRSENFISEKLNIKPMSRGELRINSKKKNGEYDATDEQKKIIEIVYRELHAKLQERLEKKLKYIHIMDWDWLESTHLLLLKTKRNMTFMLNDNFMKDKYPDTYAAMVAYTDYGKIGQPYIFVQVPITYDPIVIFEKLGADTTLCQDDYAYEYLENRSGFDKEFFEEMCKLKGSLLYNGTYTIEEIIEIEGYDVDNFMIIPFALDNINTVDDLYSENVAFPDFVDNIVKTISKIDDIAGNVGNNTIKKLHLK